MSETTWVALVPRDTVLVRDGRQFDASVDAVAETVWPGPSTVAGAVGAALGIDPENVRGALRGPLLARRTPRGWLPYLPVPADLVSPEDRRGSVRRLAPVDSDVVTDLSDRCPCLLGGDGARLPGWLPAPTVEAYLAGRLVAAGGIVPLARLGQREEAPLSPEPRLGLARGRGLRTARSGFLYQMTHLRPRDGWAFLAACELPDEDMPRPTGPVPLGGRGRLADVEVATGVGWPARPVEYPDGRVLVYVATQAIWPKGWALPVPPAARLVATAVPDPEPVATASPRRGVGRSRALRWAVPAGSVYLLEFDGPATAADWAADVHEQAYGRPDDDRLRTAGFGVVLTGVW